MQISLEFTGTRSLKTCETPQGKLVITRVPGHGLQGYFRPVTGRSQVWVAAGKHKTQGDTVDAMIAAYRNFVGLDEIRSFV
jgi:hypothetical protein